MALIGNGLGSHLATMRDARDDGLIHPRGCRNFPAESQAVYGAHFEAGFWRTACKTRLEERSIFAPYRPGDVRSDDLQQEKDQDDDEDQADAPTSVVSQAGAYAISAISKSQDKYQQDDNQKHAVSSARQLKLNLSAGWCGHTVLR